MIFNLVSSGVMDWEELRNKVGIAYIVSSGVMDWEGFVQQRPPGFSVSSGVMDWEELLNLSGRFFCSAPRPVLRKPYRQM